MNNSNIISIQPLGFPWVTQDPFLFCVHHKDDYPRGRADMSPDASLTGRNIGQDFTVKDGWRMYHGQRIPGFPYHPHRGFETVTITETGLIDHADSLGAAGRFGDGDVQWMTAGSGVLHSEMFPMLNEDRGNPLEFFQLWLNLPKAKKLVDPHFNMIWGDDVPEIHEQDANGKSIAVRVVSGRIGDTAAPSVSPDSWAADPNNEIAIWTINIESGGQWTLPKASSEVRRTLYFYRGGDMRIDGTEVAEYNAIEVSPSQEILLEAKDKDLSLLMLQGKPIGEPVAQHGPFVMNTDEEIQQAFADYRSTQFGGWPWPRQEQVHSKESGRFALYADGSREEK